MVEFFTSDDDDYEAMVLDEGVVLEYEKGCDCWLGDLGQDMEDIDIIVNRWGDGSNVDCGPFFLESDFSTGLRFDNGFRAPGMIFEVECGEYPARLLYETGIYNGRDFSDREGDGFSPEEVLEYLKQGLCLIGGTGPMRAEHDGNKIIYSAKGVKVELCPGCEAELRTFAKQADVDDICYKFDNCFNQEAEVWVGDACLTADWTTGLDFGHYCDGGGYYLGLSGDPIYGPEYAVCYYEWQDSHIDRLGWYGRDDQALCLENAVKALVKAGQSI